MLCVKTEIESVQSEYEALAKAKQLSIETVIDATLEIQWNVWPGYGGDWMIFTDDMPINQGYTK